MRPTPRCRGGPAAIMAASPHQAESLAGGADRTRWNSGPIAPSPPLSFCAHALVRPTRTWTRASTCGAAEVGPLLHARFPRAHVARLSQVRRRWRQRWRQNAPTYRDPYPGPALVSNAKVVALSVSIILDQSARLDGCLHCWCSPFLVVCWSVCWDCSSRQHTRTHANRRWLGLVACREGTLPLP